ncbi:hypothetical protein Q5752_001371 [Cryptotrichosporon argae]
MADDELTINVRRVRRRRVDRLRGGAWAVFDTATQTITVAVVALPATADYMTALPDDVSVADICMPGTHDSCALYGYPISQCQQPSTPIERQLADGVRFLDVRLRVIGDELHMYHGMRPQRSTFPVLLRTVDAFLAAHPSETLLMSLKEEDDAHPLFATHVRRDLERHRARWFLDERVPALGEVRGRAMLLSRFDGDAHWSRKLGIHPTTWPDSRRDGFEWDCHGTPVRTQDWYRIATFLRIPEKAAVLQTHLAGARAGALTLSYASASDFPLAPPTWIAKGFGWPRWGLGVWGVNDRFARWLVDELARTQAGGGGAGDGRGAEGLGAATIKDRSGGQVEGRVARSGMVVPMDFYRQSAGGSLAELIVALNFV